ncbi:MAG: hypothetical protein DMD40_12715 [Gemmatimonadetes bacterium]|nr:MAG: hypothetical protein DMD40_12715 [Gemmatimonadota bacterium]
MRHRRRRRDAGTGVWTSLGQDQFNLLFGAGGWFLDGWVHTRPLFTIIGAFVGGFAGFMSIYYRVTKETAAKGGEGRRRGGE